MKTLFAAAAMTMLAATSQAQTYTYDAVNQQFVPSPVAGGNVIQSNFNTPNYNYNTFGTPNYNTANIYRGGSYYPNGYNYNYGSSGYNANQFYGNSAYGNYNSPFIQNPGITPYGANYGYRNTGNYGGSRGGYRR